MLMTEDQKADKIVDVISIIKGELDALDKATLGQANIGKWGRLTAALHSLEEILPFFRHQGSETK